MFVSTSQGGHHRRLTAQSATKELVLPSTVTTPISIITSHFKPVWEALNPAAYRADHSCETVSRYDFAAAMASFISVKSACGFNSTPI